ncbi:MAG: M23 family metallopeptidase [Clostridiales bacterium]|nr:M23 family metallopeptidase [Clostridiales bacterium]
MKKLKIFGIIALLILLIAGALVLIYYKTPTKTFALPEVRLDGMSSKPQEGCWHTELFFGKVVRDTPLQGEPSKNLGTLDIRKPQLSAPSGGEFRFKLFGPNPGVPVPAAEGDLAAYEAYEFTHNGNYVLEIDLRYPKTEDSDAAEFSYTFEFALEVKPTIEFSSDRARQGDVLSVYVERGFETEAPTIETPLANPLFLKTGERTYMAMVPVDYTQAPDVYEINVGIGDTHKSCRVIVTPTKFSEQHMIISQSTVDSTMNFPGATKDWVDKIKDKWPLQDDTKYWSGQFMWPVDGSRITTEFGLFRYTNDNPNPTRHKGIDIGVPSGTPIAATNAGKVIYAGDVIITGKSVIIEHGSGLKSYYFHLSELGCAEGDMVEKGEIIGLVGSTGYSTGAHLHFEMRIEDKAIDPMPLLDGTSEIYRFEEMD